mmetsp:Transcript_17257/g.53057  ORF Transcript_17257/g.53057 Transcript_17257/m.53057 type:complete len:397 (+) Transcript_17257:2011-3201(+)
MDCCSTRTTNAFCQDWLGRRASSHGAQRGERLRQRVRGATTCDDAAATAATTTRMRRLRRRVVCSRRAREEKRSVTLLRARREPHGRLGGVERARRDLVGAVGAGAERVLEVQLVRGDLGVLLLDGLEVRDDRVREPRLERAPRQVADVREDRVPLETRDGLVDVEQVRRLGPLRVVPLEARELVRLALLDLARDDVRRVVQVDARPVELGGLGHLGASVLERHDARALFHDERLGLPEDALLPLAVEVVEAPRDVARQLEVLALVLAHGHQARLVQEDVRGHEDRVVEEADSHIFALLRLFLFILDHALEPVERRHAVQEPAELRMRRDVALDEDGALRGVDARRDVERRRVERLLAQLLRVMGRGDGVQVDDAKQAVVVVLELHPLADRAEIIP